MLCDINISLDEARTELVKRWKDEDLKKTIETELGENFWSEFKHKPRSILWRYIFSPDNGFIFFHQCAYYVNATPLIFEFLRDTYVAVNEEKRGLGRPRVYFPDGKRGLINLIDFNINEKRITGEVVTRCEGKLVDFHHELLGLLKYNLEIKDKADWARNIGKPEYFYYQYLLHFVAHGILFETIQPEEKSSRAFVFHNNVILPSLKKIKDKFGLSPLIVRVYPENQNEEEDFFWWCYPPKINKYLIEYAKKNNLSFQYLKQN